jgi:hypothetical protein
MKHFYHLDYVAGVQFEIFLAIFTEATPSLYNNLSHLSTSYEVLHPGALKELH